MIGKIVEGVLEGAGEWANKTMELAPPPFGERDKRRDQWFTNFWDPIYRAACALPHPQFNQQMLALEDMAREVLDTRGIDFAPAWYIKRMKTGDGLALTELEYLERQKELGCAAPAAPTKKFSATTLILGGLAIAGATVGLTVLLTRPKKRGRR